MVFAYRLVYVNYYSKTGTLEGYIDFSLSRFNVSEFKSNTTPLETNFTVSECRYQDFRYDSGHPEEYERTSVFWNVMAARLIFVVIFENVVAVVMILVRWLIPDSSTELRDQIRREAYITNEIIIKQEALRASRVNSARPNIKNDSAWNRLLSNNLSGPQLDLYIHNENETRSRNQWKKRKSQSQDFIDVETSHNNNDGEYRKTKKKDGTDV
jgi:anoctamin-1